MSYNSWTTPTVTYGAVVSAHVVRDLQQLRRGVRMRGFSGGDSQRAVRGRTGALQEDLLPDWRRPEAVGSDCTGEGSVIAEALAQLSEVHRQVLLECFYHGRTVAEAASQLGIPAGKVKSHTLYALRSLRLVLEEMGVTQ